MLSAGLYVYILQHIAPLNLELLWRHGNCHLEGISGQVYKGTYYGIPVAVKEISDEEEFEHEEEIIFGDQMLHPSITM